MKDGILLAGTMILRSLGSLIGKAPDFRMMLNHEWRIGRVWVRIPAEAIVACIM